MSSTHDKLGIMSETDILRRNVADMEEQIHRRNTRVVELLARLAEAERKLAVLQPAWQIESTSKNAEYLDIDCVDGSAKADLRAWRITIDCVDGAVYGVLRRSKDAETPFDDGVDLPQKMVGLILGVIAPRTLEVGP